MQGEEERTENRVRRPGRAAEVILFLILILTLVTGRIFQWMMSQVSLNLDEILYTLKHPVDGTDPGFYWSIIRFSVLPAAAVFFVILTLQHFLRGREGGSASGPGRKKPIEQELTVAGGAGSSAGHPARWRRMLGKWLLPVCTAGAVIFCAVSAWQVWTKLGISEYLRNSRQASTWIEDQYVDPEDVSIVFPEKKRNLIYLYLESMEVSFSDLSSGGIFEENYIPNLTKLSGQAQDFSGPEGGKLNGASSWKYTTWTMGGMFAATSGLPLKIPIESDGFDTNYMSTQDTFFPNITTLGDILQEEGYENDLLIGSDATFGGRRLYFSTHGAYEFYDYNHYAEDGSLPSGYKVFWGFEDEKLFGFAKKRLDSLSKSGKPFNLTMLTVDTHYPDGYTCRLCEDTYGSSYANAIACSDRQVSAFLDWCREQEWYEDTAIVVSGDHPTMASFCDGAPDDYVRKVYTAYLNPAKEPVRNEWREYATVDNFPTTLSALGCEIEGGRLGLGTDLFSGEDTLTEMTGRTQIDQELSKSSLWMQKQANVEPLTGDITYDPYDEENHVLSFTIRNVSSDKVDGFRCCMKMYGYRTSSGKDYIKWISAEEIEPGVWRAQWTLPVDQAYEGIVKLQPTCMVDGARSNVLDLHFYHLKYDAGGGNCEWYECDSKGRALKS
ncbi:MAG TPA: phosphoglycerol transferase [Lachnospiraceae bacterium]|nr:phosphoglycerol transferase [Lachnospiraceae bacterium]